MNYWRPENLKKHDFVINICSKNNPMPKGAKGRWDHNDVEMIDDDYGSLASGGSYEQYRCINCGKTFWEQLPD